MKFTLRFVWFVLRTVIIAVSAFALLLVAFFIAMDSANVYVVVSDGMKARAANVLTPGEAADLTKYFSVGYLNSHLEADRAQYAEYKITDFQYNLSVESLWCNPWGDTATVTVVESIPDFTYTEARIEIEATATPAPPPQWQRARYKITCRREDDAWRIDRVDKLKDLPSEPTASPEPSVYISASPVPTATPTPPSSPSPSPTDVAAPEGQ